MMALNLGPNGPSLSFMSICAFVLITLVQQTLTAPVSEQSTAMESYGESNGCYYNFQHYDEGDRIITNEPCLNCTCHNRMLMCYLRVCPFTKAIGQDCKIEKRPDQCCPIISCPEVPVQLLTSTTTQSPSTEVGHVSHHGCTIDNRFYTDGAKVPSDPNKPCELCYCIRNRTACVMQECTLNVEGCKPVYQEGVCCPVRYDCDQEEQLLLETTVKPTPGLIFTTTMQPGASADCTYLENVYGDGSLIATEKPCEHCYCMKGEIVCAVQECGTPLDKLGKNCTALPPREGQCCPDIYECDNTTVSIEELTNELTTAAPAVELATESIIKEESTPGSIFEGESQSQVTEEVKEEMSSATESSISSQGQSTSNQFVTSKPEEQESTKPSISESVSETGEEIVTESHQQPSLVTETVVSEEESTDKHEIKPTEAVILEQGESEVTEHSEEVDQITEGYNVPSEELSPDNQVTGATEQSKPEIDEQTEGTTKPAIHIEEGIITTEKSPEIPESVTSSTSDKNDQTETNIDKQDESKIPVTEQASNENEPGVSDENETVSPVTEFVPSVAPIEHEVQPSTEGSTEYPAENVQEQETTSESQTASEQDKEPFVTEEQSEHTEAAISENEINIADGNGETATDILPTQPPFVSQEVSETENEIPSNGADEHHKGDKEETATELLSGPQEGAISTTETPKESELEVTEGELNQITDAPVLEEHITLIPTDEESTKKPESIPELGTSTSEHTISESQTTEGLPAEGLATEAVISEEQATASPDLAQESLTVKPTDENNYETENPISQETEKPVSQETEESVPENPISQETENPVSQETENPVPEISVTEQQVLEHGTEEPVAVTDTAPLDGLSSEMPTSSEQATEGSVSKPEEEITSRPDISETQTPSESFSESSSEEPVISSEKPSEAVSESQQSVTESIITEEQSTELSAGSVTEAVITDEESSVSDVSTEKVTESAISGEVFTEGIKEPGSETLVSDNHKTETTINAEPVTESEIVHELEPENITEEGPLQTETPDEYKPEGVSPSEEPVTSNTVSEITENYTPEEQKTEHAVISEEQTPENEIPNQPESVLTEATPSEESTDVVSSEQATETILSESTGTSTPEEHKTEATVTGKPVTESVVSEEHPSEGEISGEHIPGDVSVTEGTASEEQPVTSVEESVTENKVPDQNVPDEGILVVTETVPSEASSTSAVIPSEQVTEIIYPESTEGSVSEEQTAQNEISSAKPEDGTSEVTEGTPSKEESTDGVITSEHVTENIFSESSESPVPEEHQTEPVIVEEIVTESVISGEPSLEGEISNELPGEPTGTQISSGDQSTDGAIIDEQVTESTGDVNHGEHEAHPSVELVTEAVISEEETSENEILGEHKPTMTEIIPSEEQTTGEIVTSEQVTENAISEITEDHKTTAATILEEHSPANEIPEKEPVVTESTPSEEFSTGLPVEQATESVEGSIPEEHKTEATDSGEPVSEGEISGELTPGDNAPIVTDTPQSSEHSTEAGTISSESPDSSLPEEHKTESAITGEPITETVISVEQTPPSEILSEHKPEDGAPVATDNTLSEGHSTDNVISEQVTEDAFAVSPEEPSSSPVTDAVTSEEQTEISLEQKPDGEVSVVTEHSTEGVLPGEHLTENNMSATDIPISEEQKTDETPAGVSESEKPDTEEHVTESKLPEETKIPEEPITESPLPQEPIIDEEQSTEKHSEEETVTEAQITEAILSEGGCVIEGEVYKNNSNIPAINPCQLSCKCTSSIIECETIPCPQPPPNMMNCMPIYHTVDSCCPTYTCDSVESAGPESDNHVMSGEHGTTTQGLPNEIEEEKGTQGQTTTSVPSHIPETVTTPEGEIHQEIIPGIQTPEQKPEAGESVVGNQETENEIISDGHGIHRPTRPSVETSTESEVSVEHSTFAQEQGLSQEPEKETSPSTESVIVQTDQPTEEHSTQESEEPEKETSPSTESVIVQTDQPTEEHSTQESEKPEKETSSSTESVVVQTDQPTEEHSTQESEKPEKETGSSTESVVVQTDQPTEEHSTQESEKPVKETSSSTESSVVQTDQPTEELSTQESEKPVKETSSSTESSVVQTDQPIEEHSTQESEKPEEHVTPSQSEVTDGHIIETTPGSQEAVISEDKDTTESIIYPDHSHSTEKPIIDSSEQETQGPVDEHSTESLSQEHVTEISPESETEKEHATETIISKPDSTDIPNLSENTEKPSESSMTDQEPQKPIPAEEGHVTEQEISISTEQSPVSSTSEPSGEENVPITDKIPEIQNEITSHTESPVISEENETFPEVLSTEKTPEHEVTESQAGEITEKPSVIEHEIVTEEVSEIENEITGHGTEASSSEPEQKPAEEEKENAVTESHITEQSSITPESTSHSEISQTEVGSTKPEEITNLPALSHPDESVTHASETVSEPQESVTESHKETAHPEQVTSIPDISHSEEGAEQPEGTTDGSLPEISQTGGVTIGSTISTVEHITQPIDMSQSQGSTTVPEISHPEEGTTQSGEETPLSEATSTSSSHVQGSTSLPEIVKPEQTEQSISAQQTTTVSSELINEQTTLKPEQTESSSEGVHEHVTTEATHEHVTTEATHEHVTTEATHEHVTPEGTEAVESEASGEYGTSDKEHAPTTPASVESSSQIPNELSTEYPPTTKPEVLPGQGGHPDSGSHPSGGDFGQFPGLTPDDGEDYDEEDPAAFGPGTCRYGGKVYVSAQQIPRDDPCDFCFCFRSDIICLQQSCPPPIHGCHEEPIQGFCCPRYECPVSMANVLNVTTTSTTTTTTLPPLFFAHAYKGAVTKTGCQIQGRVYQVGEEVKSSSGPCLHCTCGGNGQMKCDPKACSPGPMIQQMIEAAAASRRR